MDIHYVRYYSLVLMGGFIYMDESDDTVDKVLSFNG